MINKIDQRVEEIDLENVSGDSIHRGLHNACNHLYFAESAEEHKESRDEIQEEVRYILLKALVKTRTEAFDEILELVGNDKKEYDHKAFLAHRTEYNEGYNLALAELRKALQAKRGEV